MKRRNFLSGLLAAPLALKARLARFFGRPDLSGSAGIPRNDPKPVELCNAPIGNLVLRMQPVEPGRRAEALRAFIREVEAGRSMRSPECQALLAKCVVLAPVATDPPTPPFAHCSLPRGHKGQHVLLNPR